MTFSRLPPGYRRRYSRPDLTFEERLQEAACWAVHEEDEHQWVDNKCACGLEYIGGLDG